MMPVVSTVGPKWATWASIEIQAMLVLRARLAAM